MIAWNIKRKQNSRNDFINIISNIKKMGSTNPNMIKTGIKLSE